MIWLLAIPTLTNVVVLGGVLWFLTRQGEELGRERAEGQTERDNYVKAMLTLVDHFDAQREKIAHQTRMEREKIQAEAFRERQVLLERVQRPEQIPAQAAPDPSGEMLHVPVDDDEAYWKVRGIEPVSAEV